MEKSQVAKGAVYPHSEIEEVSTVVEIDGYYKIMPEVASSGPNGPIDFRTTEAGRNVESWSQSRPTGFRT